MSNDDLLREIHKDVRTTGATVAVLDERSKTHGGEIRSIKADVADIRDRTVKVEERTRVHNENIGELKTDAKRAGGVTGLVTGGGAGVVVWIISKLKEWTGASP